MFKYDNSISADNVLGSVGYRELTKMINHIARKCNFKKEVVAEKGIVSEIHLRHIKNNETVDTISIYFNELQSKGNVCITTTYPTNKKSVLGNELVETWHCLGEYAEQIIRPYYLPQIYNNICEKLSKVLMEEKMVLNFSGGVSTTENDTTLTLRVDNIEVGTDKVSMTIHIYFGFDTYEDNVYIGWYQPTFNDYHIEVASDNLEEIVNATVYYLIKGAKKIK